MVNDDRKVRDDTTESDQSESEKFEARRKVFKVVLRTGREITTKENEIKCFLNRLRELVL